MVIKTTKTLGGVTYDYTYSDSGFMIDRDGVRYAEAIDPLDSGRAYTETDEPIESDTGDATVADYQSALSEFGVEI